MWGKKRKTKNILNLIYGLRFAHPIQPWKGGLGLSTQSTTARNAGSETGWRGKQGLPPHPSAQSVFLPFGCTCEAHRILQKVKKLLSLQTIKHM